MLKAFDYPTADADELAGAIERRDLTRIRHMGNEVSAMIERLITIGGPVEQSLGELQAMALPERVQNDLKHFERSLHLIRAEEPGLALTIDPIERRGFEYQTGLSFTIFAQGAGELGRGGRYRIGGKRDGEPATGFTLTTDALLRAVPASSARERVCVAPGTPPQEIEQLQQQGYATLRAYPDEPLEACARRLGCGKLWRDGALSDITEAK